MAGVALADAIRQWRIFEYEIHRDSDFHEAGAEAVNDDSYRMLQSALMLRTDAASVIPGSGGLRKMRWSLPGSGKRGSLRVLYYWDPPEDICMIFIYQKVKQESITPAQLKVLRKLMEEHLK